jgi:hypothetical protein
MSLEDTVLKVDLSKLRKAIVTLGRPKWAVEYRFAVGRQLL